MQVGKTAMATLEVGTDAIVSGAESAAKQIVGGEDFSLLQTVIDAGGGALTSASGKLVKNTMQGRYDYIVLNREYDRAKRIAGNNARPSRQTRVNDLNNRIEKYGNSQSKLTKYMVNTAFEVTIKQVKKRDERNEDDFSAFLSFRVNTYIVPNIY